LNSLFGKVNVWQSQWLPSIVVGNWIAIPCT
jgi:hypothetical protein